MQQAGIAQRPNPGINPQTHYPNGVPIQPGVNPFLQKSTNP